MKQLERGGLHDRADNSFLFEESLDEGVEWCENKILAAEGIQDLTGVMEGAESQLQHVFPSLDCVSGLMKYLERRVVEAGEILIKQDDPSDDMYFVESGLITVELETAERAADAPAQHSRRRNGRRDGHLPG